ncbi:hypothetical protein SLA2020_522920 [Shorea laevis]
MAPDASAALAVRDKVQKFLNAAQTGNLDLLKKIAAQLDEGKGLGKTIADIKDANKRGAIHFAAREGKTEVCKYLLEELKLDVDSKDEDGETALLHAARQGHTLTAKYLLEQGANPTLASELGATALHHSAGIGNIELLTYILSKGVEVDSQSDAGTPLIWAAGHGQEDAVRVLLEHHANPNADTEDDITPLLSAVAAGSVTCVDLLVKAGANVNITAGGATPMHIAADLGSLELINCLLKAGADPNVIDEDGQKPIQVAAARGHRGAVEVLFPLTSKIDSIPEWTVDGILEYMQSEANKQQEETRDLKEVNLAKDTTLPKKDLPEVTPEVKKKAAESKSRGDEAFKRQDYQMAIDAYTQAIDLDPTDATLFSNRSLCWIRLGQAEHALADAKECRALRPDWPKACYREGTALRLLQKFDEAANAFYEGVKLDPENKELVNAFREAVDAGRKFHGTDEKVCRHVLRCFQQGQLHQDWSQVWIFSLKSNSCRWSQVLPFDSVSRFVGRPVGFVNGALYWQPNDIEHQVYGFDVANEKLFTFHDFNSFQVQDGLIFRYFVTALDFEEYVLGSECREFKIRTCL